MSKVKLLTVAVVVLIVVNVVALSALYVGRQGHHGPPRGEGPKALIIERLHFDADQVTAYEALISEHRKAIKELDAQMMDDRNALYQGLKGSGPQDQEDLLSAIANVERSINSVHLAHFAAIRELCRPDQLPYFDALVDDLAGLFRPQGPKPH